jgi:transglutaminase-like putative cysteine protease
MRLNIEHNTEYHYDEPVRFALQQLRMVPKERAGQQIVHDWTVEIDGGREQLRYTDHHGNEVVLIAIDSGAERLTISCKGDVELIDTSGVVGPHRGPMPLWAYQSATPLTEAGPHVAALMSQLGSDHDSHITRAHALSELILARLPYAIGVTQANSTAEEALAGSGGVCQDHSHIFITAMRALGHPARYVSGYLKMNDRDQQDATGSVSTSATVSRQIAVMSEWLAGWITKMQRLCVVCVMVAVKKGCTWNFRCNNKD